MRNGFKIIHIILNSCLIIAGQSITTAPAYSQSQTPDSIHHEATLNEITVTSTLGANRKVTGKGRSASIEEHLLQLGHVDMVRRGSYAWEPLSTTWPPNVYQPLSMA